MEKIIYIKNRESLIGLGALFLMYQLLIENIFSPNSVWSSLSGIYFYAFFMFTLLVRVVPTYYASKIAKEMKRNSFFWGFFTFVTPFLGLVILSKLYYKFDDQKRDQYKPILEEFKSKLNALKSDFYWKEIDKHSYDLRRRELEEEYNEKLRQV